METTRKMRRNAPCPCGSGRKFKKCCGMEKNKMEEVKELKNEFREQVRDPYAGIGQEELTRRDQNVLLLELRFRKNESEQDRAYIEAALHRAKDLRVELSALAKSPYRELVIKSLADSIKANEQKIATLSMPVHLKLALLALEELFDKPAEATAGIDAEPVTLSEAFEPDEYDEDGPEELRDD